MAAGYELNTKSGTAATSSTRSAFDSSGWQVNFGSGSISASAGVPAWVWIAGAVGALLWLRKHKA